MRSMRCVAAIALFANLASAACAQGLSAPVEPSLWSQVQTRARFGQATAPTSYPALASLPSTQMTSYGLPSGMVLGDYYFRTRGAAPVSGFRASSGLLFMSRSFSLAEMAVPTGRTGVSMARLGLPVQVLGDSALESATTLPYLGLGYSRASLSGAVRFSADLGLVAQSAGHILGLSRVLGGSRSLDDVLREMRLAPVLQLGVNYTF